MQTLGRSCLRCTQRGSYENDEDEDMQEMKKLKAAKHEIEEKIKSISVKEDVDALVEGEDLSEDFKEKA